MSATLACATSAHASLDALEEQLKRAPRPFPSLTMNPAKKHIDDFEYDDFTVDGYKPYPKIQMEMAV